MIPPHHRNLRTTWGFEPGSDWPLRLKPGYGSSAVQSTNAARKSEHAPAGQAVRDGSTAERRLDGRC